LQVGKHSVFHCPWVGCQPRSARLAAPLCVNAIGVDLACARRHLVPSGRDQYAIHSHTSLSRRTLLRRLCCCYLFYSSHRAHASYRSHRTGHKSKFILSSICARDEPEIWASAAAFEPKLLYQEEREVFARGSFKHSTVDVANRQNF